MKKDLEDKAFKAFMQAGEKYLLSAGWLPHFDTWRAPQQLGLVAGKKYLFWDAVHEQIRLDLFLAKRAKERK